MRPTCRPGSLLRFVFALLLLATLDPARALAQCVCGDDDGLFTTHTGMQIDGSFADWAVIHADPENNSCDGPAGGLLDRDAPVQSTGRDVTHFALTWDDTGAYLYTRRDGSSANVQRFLYYGDTDNDGLMESGEPVIGVNWQGNTGFVEVYLFTYEPDVLGGDPMVDGSGFGDGYTLPGSFSNVPQQHSPTRTGFWGGPNQLEMEFFVSWGELGIAPGTAFTFHVSSANTYFDSANYPDKIDDNLAGCGGGAASTQFAALTFTPDVALSGPPGSTQVAAHTLSNLGNGSDVFDLASVLSGNHTPVVTYHLDVDASGTLNAGDTPLTDTDGDGVPDTGALAAGASVELLIAYQIADNGPGDPTGVATIVTTATSSFNPAASAAVTDTVTVLTDADLSLTKTVSNPTPAVGELVTFTLTLANAGPNAASGVGIRDPLPVGFAYSVGSMTGGDVRDESGAPDLLWTVNTLASGATVVLTFDAVVQAPTGAAAEHDNTAEVSSADQGDPDSTPGNGTGNGEDDEASASVVPVTTADVSLAKTVSDPTPTVGDTVTFFLTLSNSGPEAATGLSVEDALPVGFGYVPGSIAGGDLQDDSSAPILRWDLLSLPAASSAALQFDAVVQAPTGAVDEYRNVAQLTAADLADPDSAPANDDGDQSEDDEAALLVLPVGIGVSFAPDHTSTALAGSAVFYAHTLLASRDGSVTFSTSAVDSPPVSGWAQTVFHDLDCSASLEASEPSLQPSDAVLVTAATPVCIVVRESVPPAAPAGAQDLVSVIASFVPSGGGMPASLTARDLTTVTGVGGAGLQLQKQVDKSFARPGEQVTYTILYTNQGSGPLTQLVIHDATPAFTTYLGGSAQCQLPLPAGLTACTPSGPAGGGTGSVQWTFGGGLNPGETGSVTYTVTLD